MQFKIKNTTYKISFSFLALILFAITVNKSKAILILLFFAITHELVHLIFIYYFSVAPQNVTLTILGANISRGIIVTDNLNSEILINISAPVFNIITGAVFYLILRCNPNSNSILFDITDANFVLGFFNLIPFYSFDGGNALKYVLLKYIDEEKTEKTLTIISLLITIAFSFISLHIFLNYQHNFSLLIVSIYMFISIIFKKQNSLDY